MSASESRQQPYLSLADVKLVTNRSSKPSKLKVKHTFLEVDTCSASPPGSPQARARACSDGAINSFQNDSILMDLQSSDFKSPPVAVPVTSFNALEEEIVLCGLSDSEDAASGAEDQESTTTATRSVIASRSVNSSDVSTSFQSEEMLAPSAPCTSAAAVQQEGARKELTSAGTFEGLSIENQRLARENAVLRQKCLEVAQAAQQAAAATASAARTHNLQPSGFADAHASGMTPSQMPAAHASGMAPNQMPATGGYPSMPSPPVPTAGASPQQFAFFCQMPGFDNAIFAIPATAVMMQATPEQCVPQLPQQRVPDAPRSKMAAKQNMHPAGPVHRETCMKGAEGRAEEAFNGEGTSYATGASQELTTVMLRNVPNNYNRTMLLKLMGSEGFDGQYDFIYLPIDFKSRASLGYAFVNLTSHEAALRFMTVFRGYSNWVLPSKKVCSVDWSGPHQGLEAHVERYRNSPVMHEVVPDMYKPILFKDGVRVPFPPATKKLREPRIRNY